MADKAIGDLPAVSTVDDNIQFPVDQSGIAMRLSISDLEAKAGGIETIEITVSGQTVTASKTAQEIYNAVVNKKKSAIVIMPIGSGTNYIVSRIERVVKSGDDYTAFFYVEYPFGTTLEYAIGNYGTVTETDSYIVTQPNKNTLYTGDTRLSLNYTPTSNLHAVNKAYVDSAVANAGGGGSSDSVNIVIVTLSENDNKVYRNGTDITGTQINNLVVGGSMVYLWHESAQRLYDYSETLASGGAKFIALGEKGTVSIMVQPTSNATVPGSTTFLPNVNYYNDDGKVLGVVEGEWTKTSHVLPAITTSNNGMVLGVVNGNWTLIDPSTFSEE